SCEHPVRCNTYVLEEPPWLFSESTFPLSSAFLYTTRSSLDLAFKQYEVSPPDGWPRWMDKKIRDSRLILMICTETYCKRVMGEESPDKGMGVRWEGGLIYQHLYNAGANQKFIPVLFRAADKKFIPTPLQSATHYELDSEAGYDRLYARLLNRPGVRKPELGRVRPAPKKEVKTNLSMYVTGPIY